MSLCTQFLRPTRICSSIVRNLGATAEALQVIEETPLQPFRTIENNPAKHTTNHLNRFYTISNEIKKRMFRDGGIPKSFAIQSETFTECCVLVRSPALEIISYLNQTDYTRPPNKYVLYGKIGTGKSITMMHLLHYAAMTKKIIVHVPWALNWYKYPKEVAASQKREGYFDLPVDGAAWLVHFKNQNQALLGELDLKVSKDYEWSSREVTKCGSPLIELIDLGIKRLKYSSEIIYTLTDELKKASTAGKCQTIVAIDGFNTFFEELSKIKDDSKQWVKPMRVTLTQAFLNMTKYDWCNGAIILTVDELAEMYPTSSNTEGLPRKLLGKEGFEHLDPFLPIRIEEYSADEFQTVMEYLQDRKWLRNVTPDGIKELEMLTARNPLNVMRYTASL